MSSPIRVLFLAPRGSRAGQLSRYSFLDEEIRALAEAGVEAYVLCGDQFPSADQGRLHLRALPRDTASVRLGVLRFLRSQRSRVPLANLTSFRELYRALRVEQYASELVRAERIDLIHSYFAWPQGYGGLLASGATQVPLIAGLRGSDVNMLAEYSYGARRKRFFDRSIRRLLTAADCTVYVSEFLRRGGLALGARPESARVILKGVRVDLFKPGTPFAETVCSSEPETVPVILAVAGLVPIKGISSVLQALAILQSRGHLFNFVVCGEGPEREALEEQVRQSALDGRVIFRGRVSREEIRRQFSEADIFVHGSVIEASGNALLEAMASGLPIVCTDAGGPAEYVDHGVTGYVVPVSDAPAMADQIERLLSDRSLRRGMGLLGRQRAEQTFRYESMIATTIRLYHSVLERRHTVPGGGNG